jgi:hypothetical protein
MDTPVLLGTGFLILGFFVWIFCAYYAYQTAPKFGRGAVRWAILGIIFGPIALMALYVMPRGHRTGAAETETSGEPVHHKDPRADLYEVPKKKHH